MDTINTIDFQEENTYEDCSFNAVEEEAESSDHMEEETTQEEESQEPVEQNATSDEEEEESLDMEQIPLGTEKIMLERNGVQVEGEELVFVNPDTDLPVQTIDELDSKDLDDECDVSFNPENCLETPSQEEDEECEDVERDSVDGEGLNGVMMKLGVHEHAKLVWADEEQSTEEALDEDEEEEMPEAKYVEEEDPDFNPVYCGETLSDCDEEVEGEAEPVPTVLNLAGDTCIMKCEEQMMIPTDTGIPVGPPAGLCCVEADAPMECE